MHFYQEVDQPNTGIRKNYVISTGADPTLSDHLSQLSRVHYDQVERELSQDPDSKVRSSYSGSDQFTGDKPTSVF